MRRPGWNALLALLCLSPAAAHAQNRDARGAVRQIDAVMAEFNEELRSFERDLKYFHKVRDFGPMLEIRNQLVGQAAEMVRLERSGPGSGPAIRELAREMDREARELSAKSGVLRKRADTASSAEDQRVADRLKTQADLMVKSIDTLATLFR
jgi:hypothetical protein